MVILNSAIVIAYYTAKVKNLHRVVLNSTNVHCDSLLYTAKVKSLTHGCIE